jgi:O-antigen ligase
MRPVKAPTKLCPHRFCRRLHQVAICAGLVVALTGTNIVLQVVALLAVIGSVYSWWLRRKYKLPAPPPLPFDRPNPYLQVRKWWARAATAGDAFLILAMLSAIAGNIGLRGQHASAAPVTVLSVLIGAAIVAVLYGAIVWCHYKATRPAKPKRVRVPANAAFGGAI